MRKLSLLPRGVSSRRLRPNGTTHYVSLSSKGYTEKHYSAYVRGTLPELDRAEVGEGDISAEFSLDELSDEEMKKYEDGITGVASVDTLPR